ncbi:MAG: HAD-IA family hydrolase [Clostridia bacterium]|nr:HAD-IA family hydrolase [Clostridia bacterium]
MIKAVIFDLDGTLVNSLYDLADAVNFALEKNGFPTHETEKYKYFVGNGIPKLIERAVPEDSRNAETLIKVKADFFEYYTVHYADKTAAYDGMKETIDKMRASGLKLAVVTNKADNMAKAVAKAVYGDIFDVVIGLSDEFPSKPHPASTLDTVKKLSVSTDECIFVGDSSVDMQTGVNSKITPVGVTWGFRSREELKDNGACYIIDKPCELLNIIEEL